MMEHLRENIETVLACDACGSIKFRRRTEGYKVEIVRLLVDLHDGNTEITDDWLEDIDGSDETYSYNCAGCGKEFKEEDLSSEKMGGSVIGYAPSV